jgi:hypothetical protein
MEETLNTINYALAGFVVIFGSILGYIVSLFIRFNNLKKDEEILTDQE